MKGVNNLHSDTNEHQDQSGYVVITNTLTIAFVFRKLVKCPKYCKPASNNHCIDEKQGLSHSFEIKCIKKRYAL